MTERDPPDDEKSGAPPPILPGLGLDSEFRKNLERAQSEWGGIARQVSEGYRAVAEALIPKASELADRINAAARFIVPFLEQMKEVAESLPPAYRAALLMLGRHGWYLDPEMSLSAPLELGVSFKEGGIEQAEKVLAEYFDGRVDQIEQFIIEAHPSRAKVLSSAFNAHRAGQFDLSIPVFLAQTDGICREVAGQYLFTSAKGKAYKGRPGMAAYVEERASDTFLSAILSPLGEKLPISTSEAERGEGWTALNRHMVLHGESVDYGTKINSLKAISLINYVVAALRIAKRDAD